jgi:peptidoglycan/LPS O-acetylase OafA/YrhL
MPEPVRGGQRYLPGLDGLRALAVLAVLAYHLGLGWAPGGLLGVGVFFTLSGYLITDLLLGAHARTGSLQLADFWLRRARRLLPALFVMLAVVTAWVALLDRSQLAALRGAVAASVAYVSNWWLISQHASYFARFGPPSPLGHLWSLAVEEQFYLIWPWLLLAGLRLARPRAGGHSRAAAAGRHGGWQHGGWQHGGLAVATLALAAASAAAMAVLYRPGYDPTRVYDGTDTRAFALLIGAALAFAWPSRDLRRDLGSGSRWCLDAAGLTGLLVICAMIWRTSEYSGFMYRGGLVLLSLATALVIAAVAVPGGLTGRALGVAPARWIGVRSYGIYLWHFPVIALTTPADGRETLAREALQVAATIAVAALSWRLVEEPVRHGALGRWWSRLRSPAAGAPWRPWAAGTGSLALACTVLACAALAGALLAGAIPAIPARLTRGTGLAGTAAGQPARAGGAAVAAPGRARGARQAISTGGAAVPGRTSCTSVADIGDSTSEGMISADYLPDKAQRLGAQYAKIGVRQVRWEISGARSIVETYEGHPNAHTVAQRLIAGGYQGCWVLALGTNDTADVAVGSPVGLAARIAQMMAVIGDQPVMWVNVKSLLYDGPYAEANMQAWDRALLRACARYPNMRVYDWAAVARPRWFISDEIHYTSAGYAARARLIAHALTEAFPATASGAAVAGAGEAPAGGCVVH